MVDLIKRNKDKGFTLIELVIVIVIISILSLIMVPNIAGYVGKADEAAIEANLRQVYTGVHLAKETEGSQAVFDDYGAFMNIVADYAGIPEDKIGAYTYNASENAVYYYRPKVKKGQKQFVRFDGFEFSDSDGIQS